jgi:L-ascorbate metabolism protein UlaG (beta-lactamase superfamily)
VRITFVGHSTVLVELDGLRLLTDPVLRSRVLHIVREPPAVRPETIGHVDIVLISHMHHDHFDPASLRTIAGGFELVVPSGGGKLAAKLGLERVTELEVDETSTFGEIAVTATHAEHRSGRLLHWGSESIGFKINGSQNVYFAGDTDIFPGMKGLQSDLDLALLPVGGWGPRLGPGHLDATRAAESLALLDPRVAVPIHWGTLYRIGLRRSHRALMSEPPRLFAQEAARLAPSVDVRILEPGESTIIDPVRS